MQLANADTIALLEETPALPPLSAVPDIIDCTDRTDATGLESIALVVNRMVGIGIFAHKGVPTVDQRWLASASWQIYLQLYFAATFGMALSSLGMSGPSSLTSAGLLSCNLGCLLGVLATKQLDHVSENQHHQDKAIPDPTIARAMRQAIRKDIKTIEKGIMLAKSNNSLVESCQACRIQPTPLSIKSHTNISALLLLMIYSMLKHHSLNAFGDAIGSYLFCIRSGFIVAGLSNQLKISRLLLRHQLAPSHHRQLTIRVLKTSFKAVSDSASPLQISLMDSICSPTRKAAVSREGTNDLLEVPFHGRCPRCHHFLKNIFLALPRAGVELLRLHCESCDYSMLGIARTLTRTSRCSLENLLAETTQSQKRIPIGALVPNLCEDSSTLHMQRRYDLPGRTVHSTVVPTAVIHQQPRCSGKRKFSEVREDANDVEGSKRRRLPSLFASKLHPGLVPKQYTGLEYRRCSLERPLASRCIRLASKSHTGALIQRYLSSPRQSSRHQNVTNIRIPDTKAIDDPNNNSRELYRNFVSLANALAVLHVSGSTLLSNQHSDVKPQNIMIQIGGGPKAGPKQYSTYPFFAQATVGKKYNAYYNAAAHLCRVHFNPNTKVYSESITYDEHEPNQEGGEQLSTVKMAEWMRELDYEDRFGKAPLPLAIETANEGTVRWLFGQEDAQPKQFSGDVSSYRPYIALKDIHDLLTIGGCVISSVRWLKEDGFGRCLMTEVGSIAAYLRQLHRYIGGAVVASRSRTTIDMLEELQIILTSCMTTFVELKRTLDEPGLNQPWRLADIRRWRLMKQTMSTLFLRLQDSRVMLSVFLMKLRL